VFGFERQSEAVDDAAENLEQFPDSVELLRLVDEAEEDVVDVLAYERAKAEELAVDTVQHGLEAVPLAWVLRIEQL